MMGFKMKWIFLIIISALISSFCIFSTSVIHVRPSSNIKEDYEPCRCQDLSNNQPPCIVKNEGETIQPFQPPCTVKNEGETIQVKNEGETIQVKNEGETIQFKNEGATIHSFQPPFTVKNEGETIQPFPVQVHISTAIFRPLDSNEVDFNLFLNGWVRHETKNSFKCCLLTTDSDGHITDKYVEAEASVYNIYKQWIVDMQSAEFTCSIPRDRMVKSAWPNFTYVALASNSCMQETPRDLLPIIYPKKLPGSVGVCLKVSYGSINATRALEWLEYHRMMGVDLVFTYTSDLDPPVQAVFDRYSQEGFLQTIPAHPAKSENGPERGFRHPRYDQQAWVDEVWACNDCKHRMSGFDFVIVMDIDEFIVPLGGLKTYHDVLSMASNSNPNAGTFRFNSYVISENWKATRDSPLHITRFTRRTKTANYLHWHSDSRWAFIPDKTFFVQNNVARPKKPYTQSIVQDDIYKLFHYRSCKVQWKDCETRARLEDENMLDHELPLVKRLLDLPHLDQLLYNDTDYVKSLRQWYETHQP